MKKTFISVIAVFIFAFANICSADITPSISIGAVSNFGGSVSGNIILGITQDKVTTQAYINPVERIGLDLFYTTNNGFMFGIGGVQGKGNSSALSIYKTLVSKTSSPMTNGHASMIVGVVGKKFGNFTVLSHISEKRGADFGTYYTFTF